MKTDLEKPHTAKVERLAPDASTLDLERTMEKHFLATIGDEQGTPCNLRFVRYFFERPDEITLTLFHVAQRSPADYYQGRAAPPAGAVDMEDIRGHAGFAALKKARDWARTMGWPEERIRTKIVFSRQGVVKDVVQEGRDGLYDAVLLGRRGLTWFEEVFTDSVSHQTLWEDISFPVWICRRPDPAGRNVLLAADGSPASLRMADHVGFMLAGEPRHKVLVLHVAGGSGGGAGPEEVLTGAVDAILKNGVDSGRIETKVVKGEAPAQAILAEVERGGFAVAAMGRSGARAGRFGRVFHGSTSLTILRELGSAELWIGK